VRWHQTKTFECCGERHSPLDSYAAAWRDGSDVGAIEVVWDWWEGDRYAVYRAKCPSCQKWGIDNEHASFQASKLYSPWQKDRPADIAKKWIDAHGDEDLKQTWWNTQMGLPYRPHSGKELQLEALASRGEVWPAEIPVGVAAITVGVDVQDDRVEMEAVGWGRNEESWSIDYHIIEGDPESVQLWDQVDAYLKRIWFREDGRGFEVMAACIDSGGHHTQKVYEFAKARLGRRIWAIKGESARTGQRSPVWPAKKPTRRNKAGFRPVIIGVNAAKDTIRARLHSAEPGAGYMHFPSDRDINYFAQLTAERSVTKVVAGQRYRVWELPRGKANEALDCRVYAYAALCGLLHLGLKLNKRADDALQTFTPREPIEVQDEQIPELPSAFQVEEKSVKKSFISRLA
jgi:phage terminase large subunit GpA-like protein